MSANRFADLASESEDEAPEKDSKVEVEHSSTREHCQEDVSEGGEGEFKTVERRSARQKSKKSSRAWSRSASIGVSEEQQDRQLEIHHEKFMLGQKYRIAKNLAKAKTNFYEAAVEGNHFGAMIELGELLEEEYQSNQTVKSLREAIYCFDKCMYGLKKREEKKKEKQGMSQAESGYYEKADKKSTRLWEHKDLSTAEKEWQISLTKLKPFSFDVVCLAQIFYEKFKGEVDSRHIKKFTFEQKDNLELLLGKLKKSGRESITTERISKQFDLLKSSSKGEIDKSVQACYDSIKSESYSRNIIWFNPKILRKKEFAILKEFDQKPLRLAPFSILTGKNGAGKSTFLEYLKKHFVTSDDVRETVLHISSTQFIFSFSFERKENILLTRTIEQRLLHLYSSATRKSRDSRRKDRYIPESLKNAYHDICNSLDKPLKSELLSYIQKKSRIKNQLVQGAYDKLKIRIEETPDYFNEGVERPFEFIEKNFLLDFITK